MCADELENHGFVRVTRGQRLFGGYSLIIQGWIRDKAGPELHVAQQQFLAALTDLQFAVDVADVQGHEH
jgi:hypothetical protein